MEDIQKKTDENPSAIDLRTAIRIRRSMMIRMSNSELISLFWETGNELNTLKKKINQNGQGQSAFATISGSLVKEYGRFFSPAQLDKMALFAYLFPDVNAIRQFSYFLSWEHFLLLLEVKDRNTRHSYARLVLEKGLSPAGLKKVLAKEIIKPDHSGKKSIKQNEVPSQILKLNGKRDLYDCSAVEGIFKRPQFRAFRDLMEPKLVSLRKTGMINNGDDKPVSGFITKTVKRINSCSDRQNRLSNANMNLLCWEIGKLINRETAAHKKKRREVISAMADLIAKEYNGLFDKRHLHDMALFATKVPDLAMASWAANLLTWQHIRIVIKRKDFKEFIYYSGLTAAKGLDARSLQNEIAKKRYETVPAAQRLNRELMKALKNPLKRKTVTKKGNAVEVITTIEYNFAEIDKMANEINCFRNDWFVKMVTGKMRY